MTKNKALSYIWILVLIPLLNACTEQETILPVKKNIEDAIFASGHIEQENSYSIFAKADGILIQLPVKEGDQIQKGQLIASIENEIQDNQLEDAQTVYLDAVNNANPNSPQLQYLQKQIDQATQQLAFDKENYQRYKGLWEKQSIAKIEFEKIELQYQNAQSNLEALKKNYDDVLASLELNVERSRVQVSTQQTLLQDYEHNADKAGQVINVFKKKGELVRKGELITKIGSGDYLIKLFISEEDITQIELGQTVGVNINTYPNEVFTAEVSKIYPGFDAMEQSYIVEAKFQKLPEKMFSGTQVQANIKTGQRQDVLVIPTDYLIKGSFVMLGNGEEKEIVTGSKNNLWTEVISGITENDPIIKSVN